MSVPAPRDPAFAGRADLLVDGDALAAQLAESLDVGEVRCRPRYARYKPCTSLLVQYELDFRSLGRIALGHAWLFADGHAERTWQSASFRRLVERSRRRHLRPPQVRAVFLRDAGALFELAPLDSRLPALVRAASGKKLRRLIGEENAEQLLPGLGGLTPDLIRHKPGRKALLRYAGSGASLYVKVHAGRLHERRLRLTRLARAAGVETPAALADVADLGALVYEAREGTRLADLRGTPLYRTSLEAAARALASLHRAPPPGAWRASDELQRLEAAAGALSTLAPEVAGLASELCSSIAREIAELPTRPVFGHGDFYDDQLLVSETGAILLDLDEARPLHPLFDVGNFLAHITARERAPDALRARFLAACEAESIDTRKAALFEAAALLALAVGPFRRLEPNWRERIATIVESAQARLREHVSKHGATAARTVLPQLQELCEPTSASSVLSRAVGRPVAATKVEIVRHKAGRRCTLRCEIGSGNEVVFVKTYARPRARDVHDRLRALHAAGVATPPVLGWDPRARVVVLGGVQGRSIAPLIRAGDHDIGALAADVLYRLHSADVVLARHHHLDDELLPLQQRSESIARQAPELADSAHRCGELALSGREQSWRWRSRPVHRDFYEDQVLAADDRLVLLDLDDAAMSEPALDVANFLAHLTLLSLRPGAPAAGSLAVARVFRRSYAARDPDLDPDLLAFLTGATLLRLADIHLTQAGPALAARLLRRAERLLRARGRAAPPYTPDRAGRSEAAGATSAAGASTSLCAESRGANGRDGAPTRLLPPGGGGDAGRAPTLTAYR